MNKVETLVDIAEYLGLSNIVSELNAIEQRSKQDNASLILPLVGEFSSGKTTLINSLTDSKKLETATKPTTATIYEVHFGCDSCHAKVVTEEGLIQDVDDIANLKNDDLANAKVVTVFD
ncbi:MAG: dynamin family protein, partial [Bacteroidales bacterium]|nr:dynamin family protein [Bacteroidales bacterium]